MQWNETATVHCIETRKLQVMTSEYLLLLVHTR